MKTMSRTRTALPVVLRYAPTLCVAATLWAIDPAQAQDTPAPKPAAGDSGWQKLNVETPAEDLETTFGSDRLVRDLRAARVAWMGLYEPQRNSSAGVAAKVELDKAELGLRNGAREEARVLIDSANLMIEIAASDEDPDSDGIPNHLDRCPGDAVPADSPYKSFGCPGDKIGFFSVYFVDHQGVPLEKAPTVSVPGSVLKLRESNPLTGVATLGEQTVMLRLPGSPQGRLLRFRVEKGRVTLLREKLPDPTATSKKR
jgi:hypothetical protein